MPGAAPGEVADERSRLALVDLVDRGAASRTGASPRRSARWATRDADTRALNHADASRQTLADPGHVDADAAESLRTVQDLRAACRRAQHARRDAAAARREAQATRHDADATRHRAHTVRGHSGAAHRWVPDVGDAETG